MKLKIGVNIPRHQFTSTTIILLKVITVHSINYAYVIVFRPSSRAELKWKPKLQPLFTVAYIVRIH